MVKTIKLLRLEDSVLQVGSAGDLLYVIDNLYHLYRLSGSSYDILHSTRLTKTHEPHHKYTHCFALSPKAHFCIALGGTDKATILAEANGELKKLALLHWHESDIESSAFSPDGRYLASGGQDGHVFVYDTKNYALLTSLPPRSDYIAHLAFSSNSEFLCTCGYDKSTILFDLHRNRVHAVIKTKDVAEQALFFEEQGIPLLYLVTRNGTSIIYNLLEKRIESQENLFPNWPSCLDISPDKRYAIVGTRSESLFIIRLEDNTRLLQIDMEYPGITLVRFHANHLIIGAADGSLAFIDYSSGEEALTMNLKTKHYAKARTIVDENLFLSIHPAMSVFDEDWPDIFKQAIVLLSNEKIEEATTLVDPFLADPKKHADFNFYLAQHSVVGDFIHSVEAKKYQQAYEQLTQSPFLEKTTAYRQLEDSWIRAFYHAKKLLEEDPLLNQKNAEKTLKPFELTPKRELVQQLLKNAKTFHQGDLLVKKRNFKAYFALTEKFGFMKETGLYKKVLNLGAKMMDDIQTYDREQRYDEIKEVARFLSDFPPYRKALEEKLRFIENKIRLIDAIEKNSIDRAYEIVQEFEALKSIPQFAKLENDFFVRFEHCKTYADKGQPKRTLTCISVFKDIAYWKDKVASLMKIAYLNEIALALDDPEVNWQLTLSRFIERFGKEGELRKLLAMHQKESLLDLVESSGSREGYRAKPLVDYMVVHHTTHDNAQGSP